MRLSNIWLISFLNITLTVKTALCNMSAAVFTLTHVCDHLLLQFSFIAAHL